MSNLQCLFLFCHSLDEQYNSFWLLSNFNRRSANFLFFYLLTCHFLLPLRENELIASLTCRSIAISFVTPVYNSYASCISRCEFNQRLICKHLSSTSSKQFQVLKATIRSKYSLQLGQKSWLHFSPNSFQLQLWCYSTHLPHFCDTFWFCLFVCLFICCHSLVGAK